MRKIINMLMALVVLAIMPVAMLKAASPVDVTDVRWVTRNDAPISYVRIVLDLTNKVEADAMITRDGLSTKIVLKNTKMKDSPKRIAMDQKIVKSAVIAPNGDDLHITLQTPNPIETDDIKVFQLKKDDAIKKPVRLVIDVMQKNVKPRDKYFGMEKNAVDSKHLDKNKVKYKSKGSVDIKKLLKEKGITPDKRKKVRIDDEEVIYLSDFKTSGGIKGKVIVLDPGHGGTDVGAPSKSGTYEKELTLPIALELEKILKKAGAKVYLTRYEDVDVYGPRSSAVDELQARSDVGNDNEADIFISIHINSFSNPKIGGISSYYYPKTPYDKKLAAKIGAKIVTEKGFGGDRGVNEAGFYVLKHTTMPATLVEIGFISNPQEEKLLKKKSVQESFAQLMYEGIVEYFEGA